jgi:hypothetical protein
MKGETMNKTTKKRSGATVLVLRTCTADMTGYGGFKWPEKGPVSAPDWVDDYKCGKGLHGWLWGEGDASLGRCNESDAKWLVVEVLAHDIRHGRGELIGKCKFPRGVVVHCGDRVSATAYIMAHGAAGKAVICGTATAGAYGTATAGDGGTATAGNRGTATAGAEGTATAGYKGTATAGDWGTATAGDWGTATAGYKGTATAGDWGTAIAGAEGTATAGYKGTATAGDGGTAIAGKWGTATAGDNGTATAGDGGTAIAGKWGTATAGDGGILQIRYYDTRLRIATAYVGENGIKPNTKYRLDNERNFVEVI